MTTLRDEASDRLGVPHGDTNASGAMRRARLRCAGGIVPAPEGLNRGSVCIDVNLTGQAGADGPCQEEG